MRIHSDILTKGDIDDAIEDIPGVSVTVMSHGSRSRARAFEVRLTGTSSHRTMDGKDNAATWDEWGAFFANLFDLDGNMTCRAYKDENDFHDKTCSRFWVFDIADQHRRHKWEYLAPFHFSCHCGAEHRTM